MYQGPHIMTQVRAAETPVDEREFAVEAETAALGRSV
jgi:hypothetical protein